MINKDLINQVPEILKIASQNKFGIAAAAVLCISAIAYILLKRTISVQKKWIFSVMCISVVSVTALAFVEIPVSSAITPEPKDANPPLPVSQSTTGSQSPIQNNQNGDNVYNSASKK